MNAPKKSFLRCVAYGTASGYNLADIGIAFKRKDFVSKLTRDVFHISSVNTPVDIFIFNHGSVVCWGLKKYQELKWLKWLSTFAVNPLAKVESDHFGFHFGEEISIDIHDRFKIDLITLDADNPQVKLAISYGLAQSIKLETFEESIQDAIRKNSYLPEEMAVRGMISLSRRALIKRVGEIFIARSSINLSSEYLDVPEFFWRNPGVESYYIMTKQFLDIPSRVTSLNQKLDVLQELLAILSAQVQHRHSSFLEMTIIILILVEIALSFFQL